jgi:hypothetical protein
MMKEYIAELEIELGHPAYEAVYLKSETDHRIAELEEWIRYELEEAGADDIKDYEHNKVGFLLLNKDKGE